MAIINGRNGNVTVTTGSIIEVANLKAQNWQFTSDTPAVDTTGFNQTSASYAATLPGGTLSLNGLYPAAAPVTGHKGLVTFGRSGAAGSDVKVQSWSLTIAQPLVPIHGMGSTHQEFAPVGALNLTGSWTTLIDNTSTNTVGLSEAANNTAGHDLTLQLTDSGTDTIAFNAMANNVAYSTDYSGAPTATVSFTHTSASDANIAVGADLDLLSAAGGNMAVQSAAKAWRAFMYDANGDSVNDTADISIGPASGGLVWFESATITVPFEGAITVAATFRTTGEYVEDWSV